MNHQKNPHAMKKIALAMAMAVFGSQAGAAVITADGKLDSTDGLTYALGYTVGFIDDTGAAIGDGKLFFGINSADSTQFLYFQMPLAYVDNTYGANATADWGTKGHSFGDLLGSDSLGNQDTKKGTVGFQWNGNSVDIDYIAGVEEAIQVCSKTDKDGNCTKYKSQTVTTDYRSGGVNSTTATPQDDGAGATEKNDGKVNINLGGTGVGSILEIATSLEYNLDQFPALIGSADSGTDSGWIREVGYEIQFAAGTFNAADWLDKTRAFSLITLGNPHVSPSKKDFASYDDPECIVGCDGGGPPAGVPEPGSLALLGIGMGALGWAGRRRRHCKE